MKTSTIVSIILATATVVLGTIFFVSKLRKKRKNGCDDYVDTDCISDDDTEDLYCEAPCCDADVCTEEEADTTDAAVADKVEPETSEKE